MANDLIPVSGGLFAFRQERQVSQALARIDASTTVALRRDAARLERISQTSQLGMMAVSHMASVEAALVNATPHAADRIHAVAVAGAVGVVGIVHNAGRGL